MSIKDARGHDVPGELEAPDYRDTNRLSASINDFVPVANVTERAQLLADLAAQNPPYIPSPTRPLIVSRADAPASNRLEVNDGAGFRSVSAAGGKAVGFLDTSGRLTIPHGLGYMPTQITAIMTTNADPAVGEGIPLDYGATIDPLTNDTNVVVRVTNLRVSTWAGAGGTLRVAVQWTAR